MVQQFRRFLSQNVSCEYTCLLLFLPLIVARTVMMLIMMKSISIALDSTDLNVQSAEGDYFFERNTKYIESQKKSWEDMKSYGAQ